MVNVGKYTGPMDPMGVDDSEIRRSPPGMYLKIQPVVNTGISTTNLKWWVDGISEPSTVRSFGGKVSGMVSP